MWSFYVFNCLMLIISICSCNILLKNVDDIENESKDIECAVKIIKSVAEEGPKSVSFMGIDNDMVAELLRIDRITIVPILNVSKDIYTKTDVYIIRSEEFEDFRKKIIHLVNTSYWQPNSYFIIFIDKIPDKENFTEFLRNYNLFNVSIILKSLKKFEIYAFSAELDNCNRPKKLELMTNCFLFNKTNIFTKFVLKKLNNCRIKFATHEYLPYSGVYPFTNDIGFEEQIFKIIEERESIKFEIVKFTTPHRFGILNNKKYKGMLGMLQNHQIEGAVGGLFLIFEKYVTFDTMYPYLVDNLRKVTPLAVPLSTWEAVWSTLSLATRFFIILFFAVFVFAISYLSIFKSNRKDLVLDFLMVFGYFLNNIIPKQLKDILSYRLLLLSLLLFAFFMNVAIEASVSSVTTKPMNSYQITDQTVINNVYYPVLLKFYGSNEESSDSVCNTVLDCISKVHKSRYKRKKYRTIITEMSLNYEKLQVIFHEGNCELFVSDHSFFLSLQTMFLYRGSTITPVLKKYYRHLFHGGILSQFKKSADHKLSLKVFYNKDFQEKANRLNIHSPGALNNLKEAFIILLAGYCISAVGFIYEILKKKISKQMKE